ncbi:MULTISPECIES: hypothetical protein [Citrobacter]|uniref:Oligosaccharide repeat unit polymerase n=1 Tax=Citrobacter telavivensis TaxID=2653932 RepID=A0A6L5EH20_9ENTR|nr:MULTISPECIES: hypothetical protein [Citrobacter]MPQ53963.1 hypothetical protein [Citrobacter telavivensis]QFS71250.1 hypothetical protein GBC03_14025 [Citrobacter telavivensis]
MNIALSIFILSFGIITTIKAITKKKPMLLIFCVFFTIYLSLRPVLLALGYYNIYAYLNKSIDDYSEKGLMICLLYTLLSFLIFLLVYFRTKKTFKISETDGSNDIAANSKINVFHFLQVIFLVLSLTILPFYICFVFILCLMFYNIIKFKRFGVYSNLLLCLFYYVFLMLMLYFLSDDRRDWLVAIGAPIYIYLFVYMKSVVKIIIPGALGLLLLVYVSVAFRSGGNIFNIEAVKDRAESIQSTLVVLEVETDFSIVYDDYLLLFDDRYSSVDYLYGLTLVKPFISFIPRELLPDKPETSSRLFPKYFNPPFYSVGGSEPVTLFGELYWNFSYFSLVIYAALGYLLGLIDNTYLRNKNNLLYSSLVLSLSLTGFHLLRGPIDSFFFIYLWLALSYYALKITQRIR